MTKVLVTGATGYVGRQTITPLVESGFEVHAVARRAGSRKDVVWHEADVLDADSRQALIQRVRASHLLHLAWTTEHGRYWSDPANTHWVAATVDLARCFQSVGGERIVGVGTCAEYDWDIPAGTRLHERDSRRRPHSLYGQSKLSAYESLEALAARGDLSFAWGVLFFSFGPFERRERIVPSVINSVLAAVPFIVRSADLVRDFLDVRDQGRGLAALVGAPAGGRVNVASGSGVSLGDLAARVGAILGMPRLVERAAPANPTTEPLELVADVGRLTHEVGFQPQEDLDGGLRHAVDYWRSVPRGSA